jgi:hypothetical protein
LWAAKTENKCKLFCWLIHKTKLWTSDQITKHGGQTNPICQLCHTYLEIALHIMALCPYSKRVWQRLENWLAVTLQIPSSHTYWKFKTWWMAMISAREQDTLLQTKKFIYTVGNKWKERRRVFNNKTMTWRSLWGLARCTSLYHGRHGGHALRRLDAKEAVLLQLATSKAVCGAERAAAGIAGQSARRSAVRWEACETEHGAACGAARRRRFGVARGRGPQCGAELGGCARDDAGVMGKNESVWVRPIFFFE